MPFDATQSPKYQFGLGNQSFINFGKQARGNSDKLFTLETGLEIVQDLEDKWQPIDSPANMNMVHIDFTGGGNGDLPTFQFRSKKSIGQACHITRHALKQLGLQIQQKGLNRNVNPYQLTEALCIQDEEYRKIMTVAWSKMLDNCDKTMLFRSKVIDGVRTITSIQSENYAPIRDSLLLKSVSDRGLYVAGMTVSSLSSNYRLIEQPTEIKVGTPVDMLDIHNSDGGQRSLMMFQKLFELICTNGMGVETVNSEFVNRHFGDRQVIVERFMQAVNGFEKGNAEFLEIYNKARQTEIDSLWTIMEHRMANRYTKNQIENASVAFNSNLIASDKGTAGHVLDALTLSAQAEKSPFGRHQLEMKATSFVEDMLFDLERGKELIPVELLTI